MRNNQNGLTYLAIYDQKKFPGIHKKISGFVSVAKKMGLAANLSNIEGVSAIGRLLGLAKEIAVVKNSKLIIRWPAYGGFLLFLPVILARLSGSFVVADVPTPRVVALTEIASGNQNFFKKSLSLLAVALDGPWVLWPVNRVIQYAEESSYFSFLNKSRTYLMGNGIDLSSIPLKVNPEASSKKVQLIAVANVESWHGYDRVIQGIAAYREKFKDELAVTFSIVGEGGEIPKLKELAAALKLESEVFFLGKVDGDALFALYDTANIAIGSLGLHRKGLTSASSLKDREYCAVGLPFVASGFDCDFSPTYPYRYSISLTDDALDIEKLLDWYRGINPVDSKEIRGYALMHCDFEAKIRKIFSLDEI